MSLSKQFKLLPGKVLGERQNKKRKYSEVDDSSQDSEFTEEDSVDSEAETVVDENEPSI
jgi:hypothetical protein